MLKGIIATNETSMKTAKFLSFISERARNPSASTTESGWPLPLGGVGGQSSATNAPTTATAAPQ